MGIRRLAIILSVALTLSACGSNNSAGSALELSTDPGTPTIARVGQKLQVSLDVNGSIGNEYSDPQVSDPSVVRPDGSTVKEDSPTPMPGSGATVTWTFTAMKAGTAKIRFPFAFRGKPEPGKDVQAVVNVTP
ncbi:MAG: protease inhibitor I42 family protein [Fimbriimonadales bacterium]